MHIIRALACGETNLSDFYSCYMWPHPQISHCPFWVDVSEKLTIQGVPFNPVFQVAAAMGKALLEFVWALRFHTDS